MHHIIHTQLFTCNGKGKRVFFLLFLYMPLLVQAQIRFGYLNHTEVAKQMPQYAQAQQQMNDLKVKYENEATRSEAEFQRKFSDFLQGQKDFPTSILQKRQAELQEVMERGIAFRKEAQELLSKAEKDLLKGVYAQLDTAIHAVATQYGYAFVLNTEGNAAPYINPAMGDNITDLVRVRLGIIKEEEMTLPVPNLPEAIQTEITPAEAVPTEEPTE